MLPVASGVLTGIAAVSLGFGSVHGITLGFGTTLIGEAVDYAIYYLIQAQALAGGWRHWVAGGWPTVRLGLLTSVCGFAALVFSGFPGLAQLGVFSIAGLVGAALTTRFVLPVLMPRRRQGAVRRRPAAAARPRGHLVRGAPAAAALAAAGCWALVAAVVLLSRGDTLARRAELAVADLQGRARPRRQPARRPECRRRAHAGHRPGVRPGSDLAPGRGRGGAPRPARRSRRDRRLRQRHPLAAEPGHAARTPGQPARRRHAAQGAGRGHARAADQGRAAGAFRRTTSSRRARSRRSRSPR